MEEKEVQPIELKHRGNIGLPFGLCKKFNIDLPEEATPRDAWDALAGKGITPENVYKQLKEQATVELPEKKEEQKVVSSYTPYQKGRITKLEAGQIYKANKNGDIKVLPETIKDLYNEADIKAPYGGYFEERYNQRHYDFDKIYNATRALLNGDYSEAQEILTDYENDLIERAGKKSPYFKYRKNDNAEDEKPVATNARSPENMNETQLDNEIEKLESRMEYLGTIKGKYGGRSSTEKGLQEEFPLGVGFGHGENYARLERDNQRSVDNAVKFTEAYKEAEREQAKLDHYKKIKEQIAGTGKTYSEIKAEKAKQAEAERASQPKTMEWKTTQKEKYDSTGYSPKIISSGDYSIRVVPEMDKAVYYKDKLIAYGRTINDAKAKAELYAKRLAEKNK